jgi:hypothetical protein
MKRITYLFAVIGLIFLFSACREERVAPVNQLVKDLFCFKAGSEWTYYDSVSQTTTKMIITEYDINRVGAKSRRKTYEWAELIKIKGHFFSDFEIRVGAQGEKYDNTAILGGTYVNSYDRHSPIPLSFRCDANNNFNLDGSVTFFSEYSVNDITYKDVYFFDCDSHEGKISCYVAKHIGIIRFIRSFSYNNSFNLVLINKNIQQ